MPKHLAEWQADQQSKEIDSRAIDLYAARVDE